MGDRHGQSSIAPLPHSPPGTDAPTMGRARERGCSSGPTPSFLRTQESSVKSRRRVSGRMPCCPPLPLGEGRGEGDGWETGMVSRPSLRCRTAPPARPRPPWDAHGSGAAPPAPRRHSCERRNPVLSRAGECREGCRAAPLSRWERAGVRVMDGRQAWSVVHRSVAAQPPRHGCAHHGTRTGAGLLLQPHAVIPGNAGIQC